VKAIDVSSDVRNMPGRIAAEATGILSQRLQRFVELGRGGLDSAREFACGVFPGDVRFHSREQACRFQDEGCGPLATVGPGAARERDHLPEVAGENKLWFHVTPPT